MRTAYFLTFLTFCLSLSAQNRFELGVNLDNNGAFVNIVNHTNRYSNATGFDSLGWPTSDFDLVLLDARPATEWTNTIDDPEEYRIDVSGRYACSFVGAADVSASGTSVTLENVNYNSNSNTTYFELVVGGFPNANHGLVFLSFTNTQRSGSASINSGITELVVNRPGYPLSSAKTFTDEFIQLCTAADFSCYRFYNVQNIWGGEPTYPQRTTWKERKTTRDAAQVSMTQTNGKKDGWSWDYIVELSNILKKDIWINIHQSCDSLYVNNLALFLKTNLSEEINIYVENSNEVWSPTQATHGPYNKAEADSYSITFDQNYARRTVELSRWFEQVFGAAEINKRIRVVLAGQLGYDGRSDIHLNYIQQTFGSPNQYIHSISTSLYFGSTQASSNIPTTINSGMMDAINTQISDSSNSAYRLRYINKAKTWNLLGGCNSYEGGPHLPAGGGTVNLDNQILAHRTQEMGDILEYNYLDGWKDLGGSLAMHFTLTSPYNRYGCWGLTDDYSEPNRNYKMDAMRSILEKSTGIDALERVQFKVFPNPCSEETFIHFSNSTSLDSKDFQFLDVKGNQIQIPMELEHQKITLNLSEVESGIYFLWVKGAVKRVVKM